MSELRDRESKLSKREDIETTKKILQSLESVAVLITESVKEGWKFSTTFKILQMVSDVAALAQEVDQLLPELKDIDKREAEELAGIVYDMVRKIVDLSAEEEG